MNRKQIIEQMADIQNSDHPEKVEKLSLLLIKTAKEGYTDLVKLLITEGAEVNYADEIGMTALIEAAERGHTKTAELLIANGAEVDKAAINGCTALTLAVRAGYTKTAELLILGTKENLSEYYTSSYLAVEKFLSSNSPYLANIKRLISKRMPALRKQFCMIMNIAGLQCTDTRSNQYLPTLPPEVWQINILKSFFTSLSRLKIASFMLVI